MRDDTRHGIASGATGRAQAHRQVVDVRDPATDHGSEGRPAALTPLAGDDRSTDAPVAAARDRVRWGPVVAGTVVALASFLLVQLATFAGGLFDDGGDAGTWLTAVAALVAFFLGGLTAGGTALWQQASDGLVNGIVLWALAVVGLLLLALLGGGTLLGPISTVTTDLVRAQDVNLQDVPAAQIDAALSGARTAAGWSVLGLALSLAASVLGGMAGARLWPRTGTATTGTGSQRRDPVTASPR